MLRLWPSWCIVGLLWLLVPAVARAAEALGPVRLSHPRLVFTGETVVPWADRLRRHPLFPILQARALAAGAGEPLTVSGSRELRDLAFVFQVTRDGWLGQKAASALERAVRQLLSGSYRETEDDQNHSIVLTNMALAYDWLYELLTPDRRRDGAAALMVLVRYGIDHFGFNHKEGSYAAFNNHAAQAIAARGLAGLAAAGEHPEAIGHADWAYRQFTQVFFPAMRLVAGDGGIWNEGTHYNMVMLKPLFYFMDAVRSATGENLYAGQGWVRSTNYYWLYLTQPDETMVMLGDWFYDKTLPNLYENLYSRIFPTIAKAAREAQDPYLQAYARAILPRVIPPQVEPWHVLWFDPDLPEKPWSELPASRVFRGDPTHGGEELAVLRSGWGAGARVITLAGGDWFGHHDHYNTAAFTAFYKGDLAIDPGYDGESLQDWQFFRRTIAHNTVVVEAPEAAGALASHGWGFEGGQRVLILRDRPRNVEQFFRQQNPEYPGSSLFETGNFLAWQLSPRYDYVAVDATKAYAKAQLTRFVRHLVYLKPDVVLVYDVIRTPPGRRPRWLLQTVAAPAVAGSTVLVQNDGGELHAQVLLPEFTAIQSVKSPAGSRTEVSAGPGEEHRFLVVMHLTDRGASRHPGVRWQRQGDRLVVTLLGGTSEATPTEVRVSFPWDGAPGVAVESA